MHEVSRVYSRLRMSQHLHETGNNILCFDYQVNKRILLLFGC